MKERLFWAFMAFITVYMFIPWILTRILGIGVIRRGKAKRRVAFTFDDGPDAEYTPKLFDLLHKHGVKATFFVLGSKAEQHPELVRRMHEEGHQIGVHNYVHTSNWLMSPWRVRRQQVDRSADIVEQITGERPTYYRPPWGIINLFDYFLKEQYQIVLWSLMGRDWNSRISKTKLQRMLLRKITDGSVILLHDSGETFGADRDAPAYMLEALDTVLTEITAIGFECVRVDELIAEREHRPSVGTFKRMIVTAWMVWERLFARLFHVVTLDQTNPLLKVRVCEYTGSDPLVLSDGEQICKGDRVVELHLDNDMLFKLGSDSPSAVHLAIQLIRRMEQLLPQLSLLLKNDPAYKDVKGLYGISLIHRGTKQLGFTVVDMPSGMLSIATRLYLRLLLYVIHPQGKARLKRKSELLVPKIIAISKKELESRYAA